MVSYTLFGSFRAGDSVCHLCACVLGVGVGDLRFAYRARSFFSFQVAARNTNQTIETLNVYWPRNLEGWEGIEHSNTDSTPRAVITTVTMKSRVQNKNVHAT